MIITKILETSIDLFDANDIYQSNVDDLLKHRLEARYKNYCYQSILITDITKIIRRSDIMMVSDRLDGAAYVDVQFEVSGVILIQGEILHNCKVAEIQPNSIVITHQYASIKLQKEPGDQNISRILQKDQVIPMVVQQVRYYPNSKTISALAYPYIPTVSKNYYYHITSGLSAVETEKITMVIDQINKEEALHSNLKTNKAYDFFDSLLYSYKTDQHTSQAPYITKNEFKPIAFDIKLFLDIESGIIVYPSEDNRNNKRLFWTKKTSIPESTNMTVDTSLYPVLTDVLSKYLLYLQALRGFVETYPTADDAKKLTTYWKLCQNSQK